ncbi:uncharacterized protein LOC143242752 [Tachypleus tridentatus]|uniref:uncharacterized protein LOC143242752 n=1 Tax=Tachypleus tridentatus TaxID=6853 RepID=UPI003FCFF31C
MPSVSEEVKNFLVAALHLTADKMVALEEKLQEFGMENLEDFEFLDPEKDLEGTLNLLACRKLALKLKAHFTANGTESIPSVVGTPKSRNLAAAASPAEQCVTPPPLSLSRDNITPTTSGSGYRREAQSWGERFEIPWQKLPDAVQDACAKGTTPAKTDLFAAVRVLCQEIAKVNPKPGKANLNAIAKKIVDTHPRTFMDSIARYGQVGKGYATLANRLSERFDNLNRCSRGNSFRRKLLEEKKMEVQLVVLRESLPQCCSRIAMAVSGGSLICPTGRLRKARNSRGAGL